MMTTPSPVERWGPSHQPGRPPRTNSPLWFRLWIAGLLLEWGTNNPSVSSGLAILGGGIVLAVLIQVGLDMLGERHAPATHIGSEGDPLAAVQAHSASHGGGMYLGVDERGRWRSARAERAVLVLGPPRSGKSSAVIIPALLAHPGPAVSTSTKPDVLNATAVSRARLGRIWEFDPVNTPELPAGTPLRWSPVPAAASWDGALMMARAMVSGARVGAGTTDQTHWSRRAAALLAPLLHAAATAGLGVDRVVDWVLRHELDEPGILLERAGSELGCGVLIGLQNTEARERSSILSAAADALDAYTSHGALQTACDPNFDAERFVRSTDTVYVHAPAEHQSLAAPLVCGLLAEIRAATYRAHRGGVSGGRVLFALDEAANIAPLGELPQIASEGGGQGLALLAAFQDLSQARARWGPAADGFLTLFGSKLILPGVGDAQTLEAISLALGEYDRQVVSETRSRNNGALFSNTSRTLSTQRQRVLPPGDIANVPAGHVLYLDGLHWQLLTLTPAHQHEPWRTLTRLEPRITLDVPAPTEDSAPVGRVS